MLSMVGPKECSGMANTTGGGPMIDGPYLGALNRVPGKALPEGIGRQKQSEAAVRIDELQRKTSPGHHA
jgi:hypothetical protein